MIPKFRAIVKATGVSFPVVVIDYVHDTVTVLEAGNLLETYKFSEIELVMDTSDHIPDGGKMVEGE